MKPLIAVAVSGGVDSLMAAALLKTQGYPVFGIHFLTGYEPDNRNIAAVTDQLGIPLHVVDLTDAFRTRVIGYFLRTYTRGKTPNPCLVCNPDPEPTRTGLLSVGGNAKIGCKKVSC
ncbi:MAG: hypothetical protein P8Y74_17445 [Desulfobacterales bacterium]